jgi:hypothetical protein
VLQVEAAPARPIEEGKVARAQRPNAASVTIATMRLLRSVRARRSNICQVSTSS